MVRPSLFRLQPSRRLTSANLIDRGYHFSALPTQELETVVNHARRSIKIQSVAADLEYSFEVTPFRYVDQDVRPSGILKGATTQMVGRSIQPARIPNITADIGGKHASDIAAGIALINSVASDNVLSRDEKPNIVIEWNRIQAEYPRLESQAASLGLSNGVGTARNNLTVAYNALVAYLATIPGWNTLGTDTPIVSATFISKWTAYYSAVPPAETNINISKSGTNLYDSSGSLLADAHIKNSAVTIGANGVLSGAGGGSVTIGGLGYVGDLNATLGARIGTQIFDNQGNLYAADSLLANVINLQDWKPGFALAAYVNTAASRDGKVRRDVNTSYNLSLQTGPSGGPEVVFQSVNDNTGAALQAGFHSDFDTNAGFDPKKSYRFSLWVKKKYVTNTSGYFWFGPSATIAGSEIVQSLAGVANNNPYFGPASSNFGNGTVMAVNKWYLVVGIIHGSDYTGGASGITGLYDPTTGQIVQAGTDYKWVATATYGGMRTFQYFGEAGLPLEYARPRTEVLTAGSATVEQMMATVGAIAGTNLRDSALVLLGDSAVKNSAVSISAGGILSGAGGGTVTYGGLGGGAVGLQADLRLAGLYLKDSAGTVLADATVKNSAVSISAAGTLSGAGGGTVTYGGLGGGAVGLQADLRLGGSYLKDSAGTVLGDSTVKNTAISISAAGVLSGAGGGTVSIGGLGYTGDLNATLGARVGTNLLDSGGVSIATDAAIKNSAVSISSGGVLSGAGGGSVTIGGLGYVGDLNATLGARVGTNLLDSAGASIATDSAIKNSAVSISAAGVLSGAGGGTVTLPGMGAGPYATATALGHTNYVTDPSFELGAPTFVHAADGGAVYVTTVATSPADGLQCLGLAAGGGHSFAFPGQLIIKGTVATVSLYARDAGATNVARGGLGGGAANTCIGLSIGLYDATAASWVAVVATPVAYTGAVGTWARKAVTFTGLTPGHVYQAALQVNSGTGTEAIDIDAIQFEEGDVATGFSAADPKATYGSIAGRTLFDSTLTVMGDSTVKNSAISISAGGVLSGAGGGAITALDFASVAGATKPANNATVGATAGTDLKDSTAVVMGDSTVKNSAVSISAGGVLSGAGGGTVTIAGVAPNGLDSLADGTTYKRVKAAYLTTGQPNVQIGTTGQQIGDARNLPPVQGANLGYKYSGALTVGTVTTTTAAISISAGSLTSGALTVAYNAMTASITGLAASTTYTYYFYVVDTGYAGGTKTLQFTTTPLTIYNADANIYFGSATIVTPASGSQTGTGTGGGTYTGGGGCVHALSWIETQNRGWLQAQDIIPGDLIRVLNEDGTGYKWEMVLNNHTQPENGYLIRSESGITLQCSSSTPLTLRDGSSIHPHLLDGQELPVMVGDSFRYEPCWATFKGAMPVCYISLGGRVYLAGELQGRGIFTHNATQKP